MSKLFEDEAKERAEAGRKLGAQVTNHGGRSSQKIDHTESDTNEGRATARASKVLGVNRQYLSDADKIHEEALNKGGLKMICKGCNKMMKRNVAWEPNGENEINNAEFIYKCDSCLKGVFIPIIATTIEELDQEINFAKLREG